MLVEEHCKWLKSREITVRRSLNTFMTESITKLPWDRRERCEIFETVVDANSFVLRWWASSLWSSLCSIRILILCSVANPQEEAVSWKLLRYIEFQSFRASKSKKIWFLWMQSFKCKRISSDHSENVKKIKFANILSNLTPRLVYFRYSRSPHHRLFIFHVGYRIQEALRLINHLGSSRGSLEG